MRKIPQDPPVFSRCVNQKPSRPSARADIIWVFSEYQNAEKYQVAVAADYAETSVVVVSLPHLANIWWGLFAQSFGMEEENYFLHPLANSQRMMEIQQ